MTTARNPLTDPSLTRMLRSTAALSCLAIASALQAQGEPSTEEARVRAAREIIELLADPQTRGARGNAVARQMRLSAAPKTSTSAVVVMPVSGEILRLRVVNDRLELLRNGADGRDVVCSLLTMSWVDSRTGKPVDYTRDARKAAEYWVSAVRAGRQAGRRIGAKHYREIRYEDIVARPEKTLRALFEFVDEPWEEGVLRFHEDTSRSLANESSAEQVSKPLYTTASGRWVQDLKPADKAAVKSVAGDLLIELGYAADENW